MAQVFDLKRGCYIQYSLSPRDAVIAAHQQYTLKNWNTWEYKNNKEPVFYLTAKRRFQGKDQEVSIVTCGDFSCMCEIGKEMEACPQDYEIEQYRTQFPLKDSL